MERDASDSSRSYFQVFPKKKSAATFKSIIQNWKTKQYQISRLSSLFMIRAEMQAESIELLVIHACSPYFSFSFSLPLAIVSIVFALFRGARSFSLSRCLSLVVSSRSHLKVSINCFNSVASRISSASR